MNLPQIADNLPLILRILIRYSPEQIINANHDKKWFRAASGQTTLTVSASRQKSPRNPVQPGSFWGNKSAETSHSKNPQLEQLNAGDGHGS